jgi:signal transduction histidine kinase
MDIGPKVNSMGMGVWLSMVKPGMVAGLTVKMWNGLQLMSIKNKLSMVMSEYFKGFDNLIKGMWFISMKVDNEETWDEVKENVVNGFSIQGFLSMKLEQKEIESWQKLIRVLTHEIMNSITPISSLSETVGDILKNHETDPPSPEDLAEDMDNVKQAITTIGNRSKGLLNFVELYRNLTRIPKPNFRHFHVSSLLKRATELLGPEIEKNKIEITIKIFPNDLKLLADPDLIDQVMINLLLNAIDAVSEKETINNPKITIVASVNLNNRTTIEIADNGKGIKQDSLDKIFMPFFTNF